MDFQEYNQKDKTDDSVNETINFEEGKQKAIEINELEEKMEKKESVHFWGKNPNVLLFKEYIFEFFPTEEMSYNQKLNAITRTIVVLIILFFVYSGSLRIIVIGIVTVLAIYVLHYFHEKEREKIESKRLAKSIKENFGNPAEDYLLENSVSIPNDLFEEPDPSNPFGNVLVTDYDYNPDKKPAPPSGNTIVQEKIFNQAKKMVQDANPDHPDIADKLFNDMGSNFEFEQSLRPFHSNPNTVIPNDQTAFAEFCYGSMISCKEGNEFACARNMSRHTNY